jgi:hypothetical protein
VSFHGDVFTHHQPILCAFTAICHLSHSRF